MEHSSDSKYDERVPYHHPYELFCNQLKGDELQKLSVVQSLPHLNQTDPQASCTRLLPIVQQQLQLSSSEFHISTSRIFKELMERKIPVNLMPSTFQGIENRDPSVSNAWLETLISVVPSLPIQDVKNIIIPLATQKGLITESAQSKLASAKILGAVSIHSKIEALEIKKSVLPVLYGLYHDPNIDVRSTTCVQIPAVAKGLGKDLIVQNLLPCLVELAADQQQAVRVAAVSAVVKMFPYLSNDIIKSTMIPLSKQLCERSMKADDVTGITVAHEIGGLLNGFQNFLNTADALWFLNCYKTLAHRGLATNPGEIARTVDSSQDVMCRQACAYNLPAVTNYTILIIPGSLDILYSIFRGLAADPCYLVRRTVASGIHEIAKLLADKNKMMKNDFVRLLRDDAEEVLQTLVPNVGTTLEIYRHYGTLSRETQDLSTTEIGRALMKCQLELTRSLNWRLMVEFLSQLEHLPNCIPSDFIHAQFTPIILNCAVTGRPKPIRIQAVRTLMVFLRHNIKSNQRQWLKDHLISDICYSNSCYTRHIFMHVCYQALEIFSAKYFKEVFFIPLLSLADDPVTNVRLCVYALLPCLKEMLRNDDSKIQLIFDDVMQKAAKEKDKDLLEVYRKAQTEMTKVIDKKRKDAYETREKRLVDEEDKVSKGKLLNIPTYDGITVPVVPQMQQKRSSIVTSIAKAHPVPPNQPHSTQQLSGPERQAVSKPPGSSVSPTQSDMHFLEQHFYIDAGINLPSTTLVNENETTSTAPKSSVTQNMCDDFINALAISTDSCGDNITDDVKVNLRKIKEKRSIVVPKKYGQPNQQSLNKEELINKRHSMIFPSTCLEERKVLNRRSLNIIQPECSKIPICSKTKTLKELVPKSGIPVKVVERSPLPKSKLQRPKSVRIESSKCSNHQIRLSDEQSFSINKSSHNVSHAKTSK